MSKNPIKVMSSRLTGRIHAGRVNPKNQMFIGEKDDVTDTAVSAVAEHLLKEEICLQFEVKVKTYRLEVVEVQSQIKLQYEIDDLKAQLLLVQADSKRINFLADKSQFIANVQLPREIVERNLSSLRDAIDEAMMIEEIQHEKTH